MEKELRETGIDIIGNVSWGTHFCQFYQTPEDLIDILVPYFKAGLENNEFCMWITAEPLNAKKAKARLKKVVRNLDDYIEKGQIEILDYSQWYTKSGKFDADEVLDNWVEKEKQALEIGFDGLRLTENTFWLEDKDWRDFTEYEERINDVIGNYKMIAVCSYSLDKCRATEIMDVVANHQFALVKRGNRWELIENAKKKQADEDLQESKEKYRLMMEAIHDPIYICSADYRVEYMNPAMIKRTGHNATGEYCFKAIHGFEEKCPWCAHDNTHPGESSELEIISPKDNHSYHVSQMAVLGGEFNSKLTIFRDISEFKKMEEQLRQSQKMEAIGTLAGGVAHDFNNILTTIIGYADLMLISADTDKPFTEDIKEIKIAGERAAVLTRQLLAFSRKQIVQPKILDLNKLLTDIEKMLVRLIGEDIEILIIPESGLWKVEIDPGQMEQVIMNLVVNAKDAMPLGGKITIETVNMDLNENYFAEHGIVEEQIGSYVLLTVSDTGIGMDKEVQKHIFDPFYTTKGKGKGTGLGLSTIYGIVKQNNGFIWVYSEPGQGSTFKVYLPKVEKDVKAEEEEQPPVENLSGSETVLIVEDDNSLRKLAQKSLQSHGYRVLVAENGEDALRINKEYDGTIDLMVTDVVMPKMGGRETAKRLQQLHPQMKVIYMSGYTDDSIVHHGVLAPGLNFLEKPFSPEGLARKMREVLDYQQQEQTTRRILLIDDDSQIRKLFIQKLARRGYEIIEACNGEEGLKLYHENLPDLVITDLIMPEKEGIETIIELKREFPNVKIIAISGGGRNLPNAYLQITKSLSIERTFPKPIDWPELIKTVRELLK
jgi:two-component system cell cycle sensor histidine kinase/response regulator CckA